MSTHEESPEFIPTEGKDILVAAPRLQRGALGLVDIATSTMANIAPAMSFFFSSALIVAAAGVASPLIIIVAAVAIALLGNTLAEFSRSIPSTGSFITFIGKTFGPISAITTTIVISLGYIIAMASVITISGGWTLITHAGRLSLAPFNPANISGGLSGLGLGFPIAVYMFVGWENSAALAEETNEPRRNVPRAIYASILLMGLSYLLFMYATVVAFNYNVKVLSASAIPFLDAAQSISGILAFLAYVAGFTSTMSAMIAGSNSQARLIFNAAREGLLPRRLATLHPKTRTPWASFLVFSGFGLAVTYIFGWNVDPVTFFGEIATLGTILIALVYLVSNIALPIYYRREHPDQFSVVRHLILPILGVLAIGFPLWALIGPGQSPPFNLFPWISLGILVVAIIYAVIISRLNPRLADNIGSIIAHRE